MGGCLLSSPLPPRSVSTRLGISETSHNKLCSVRKGADAMKKQMLRSKMGLSLSLSGRGGSGEVISPNRRHLGEVPTGLQAAEPPSPTVPGTPAFPSLVAPPAAGQKRLPKPHFIPALREAMAPFPGGPRAAEKVHRGGGRGPAAARVPLQIPPLISPRDCRLAT